MNDEKYFRNLKCALFIVGISLLSIIMFGCDFKISNQSKKPIDSLEYTRSQLDSATDVFEFTPKSAPYKQCVYVERLYGGGVFCWDKK